MFPHHVFRLRRLSGAFDEEGGWRMAIDATSVFTAHLARNRGPVAGNPDAAAAGLRGVGRAGWQRD